MIFDFLLTAVGWTFSTMLGATGTFFAQFAITAPIEIGQNLGLVFGNIFLLNPLLPIDHMFSVMSLAIAWKIALFLYDGFFYVIDLVIKFKRAIISPFG